MKVVVGTYTGPASYTSGGEDLTSTILAFLRCRQIYSLAFTPLVRASTGAQVPVAFDHNVSGASQGKIRIGIGGGSVNVPSHTHDLLIIGGQVAQTHAHDFLVKGGTAAAGTDALNIKATVIGKEAATDATNLAADVATKGGVQLASTASAISMISTDTLGKESATNRTIAGSASATKGGVVAASATGTVGTEIAAATDLSLYVCRFVLYGV